MPATANHLGQPVGFEMRGWTGCAPPPRAPMSGRYCRLEMPDVERHAADLHRANTAASDDGNWTYLPYGPFSDLASYRAWLAEKAQSYDPLFHVIVNGRGAAVGVAAFMRIDPPNGVIEVGHVSFSPRLQRTAAATEAMYLMMRRAFDELGYRRYEWKCDSLNMPSRRAAERFGFTFEGIFRQALVYKGRSRDTAWYSMLDSEWPSRKNAFEQWLAPDNFDRNGCQQRPLSALMLK
jgi:RimJ/RimL family protein N-acetyltransferase